MHSMMADDSGQHENVFEDRDHAGGEHFVQRVHVGGDARDQAADRILVVEADVHALQVAENLAAQIEHHHLAGPLHEVSLQIIEQEAEDDQPDVHGRDLGNADIGIGAQERVERVCCREPAPGSGRCRLGDQVGPRTSAPALSRIETREIADCHL